MDTITVTVTFDETLQHVTKTPQVFVDMEGYKTFLTLIQSLFATFTKIETLYLPGEITFLVNGTTPNVRTILNENDMIHFEIAPHLISKSKSN